MPRHVQGAFSVTCQASELRDSCTLRAPIEGNCKGGTVAVTRIALFEMRGVNCPQATGCASKMMM
eukprot:764782-Hanusia_phi.AAC.3